MSENDYNFQRDLKNSIFSADDKIDRNELLVDIFKSYVAKLFEITLKKNRIPFDALVEVKKNLISEFMSAELSEYQKSVEWYEKLFDETVKEICDMAAERHQGMDQVVHSQQELSIDPNMYINEGGLYLPATCRK